MKNKSDWTREREKREGIYQSLVQEAQPSQHLFSAKDFVRGQTKANRRALAQFLKLPDETALWPAMDTPSFLTPGVIWRLCLWGWNPYQDRAPKRSRSG